MILFIVLVNKRVTAHHFHPSLVFASKTRSLPLVEVHTQVRFVLFLLVGSGELD